MGKLGGIILCVLGFAIAAGLLFAEFNYKSVIFNTSQRLQLKITKAPKHFLFYLFKGFEKFIIYLTWIVLFATLYLEFNKLSAWKFLILTWVLCIMTNILRILFTGSRPQFMGNIFAKSGCECTFGTPSFYAGFVVLFWLMFYKDVLADREMVKDGQKMVFKIVMVILVIMGIWARFFFGAETISQILIGVGLGLGIFGISLFDQFWESQLSNIFNSESSSCLARWLAWLLSVGFIGDFIFAWFMAGYQIKSFENINYHPYAKSSCSQKCLNNPKEKLFLSNSSLVSMAWFSFVPMILLYFALTGSVKYSNNQLNLIKYASQFKDYGKMIIKLVLFIIVNVPIIVSAFVQVHSWKMDLLFKFAMSALWVILYRWVHPFIKKKMDIFIGSDMFAPWMNDNDEEKKGLI